MTPQALRRRMAHGHIYPAERIDTALGNYFREGNLTALRELALLWVADRVEEGLDRYRAQHGITGTWAARDRIVVALTGGPEGAMLLRRGARVAGRVAGRSLIGVHVVRSDATVGTSATEIERQRLLAENLGGSLQLIVGDDIAATVLEFARSVNATQIIVGAPRHGRLAQLFRPSTANAIVSDSGDIDVHVVTHPKAARTRSARAQTGPRPRGMVAWIAALVLPCALAVALLPLRNGLALSTVLLVFLLGVIGNALIGGVAPAAAAALIAGLLANYLYTPPIGSLTISQPENVFALAVFRHRRGDRRLRRRPQRHPRPTGHPGQNRGATRRRRCDQRRQLPQPRARRPGTGPPRLRHDLGGAAGQEPHLAEHLPADRRRRHTRSHHRATPTGGAVPGHPAGRARARREPRHRRRSRPRRTARIGLGAGHVRAAVAALGPAAGRGVRRAGGARGGTGPADPPGRTGRTAAGGRPGPDRRARRLVTRPAHPAVHHQGVRLQPARSQHRLDRGRPAGTAGRHRRRRRPIGCPAGQPAGPVPPGNRCGHPGPAAGVGRRGRAPGVDRHPRRPGPRQHPRRPAAHRHRRRPCLLYTSP